jgi:hypothetical protein
MTDFSELERELKELRPAQPSPILFERVEEAMMDSRATASVVRQAKGLAYNWNWSSIGFGLAAAAILLVFAAVSMQRMRERQEVAQTSSQSEIQPSASRVEAPGASNRFVPAGATRLVYNTRDEGLLYPRGSERPLRRVRYQTQQTWQWRNPATGASLRVSYPSEEIVLIPVSGQ